MSHPRILWPVLVALSAVALGLSFDIVTITATYDDIYRWTKIVITFMLPVIWLWWGVPAAVAWFLLQLGAAVLGGASFHGRYFWDELFHVVLRAVVGLVLGLLIRGLRTRRHSIRPAWPSKAPGDYR
jgi:hypothetical protein